MNTRPLVDRLLAWFAANARDLPWRRTRDPYAIWVSEVMLQQTQVKTVVPYWERWMRALPNLRALAAASETSVLKLWEGLGYYHRARNLRRAAREIVVHHRGRFPESFDDVLRLPGVGRYTAGAIGSIAFNQPAPVLDGNVTRVLTRVFGIRDDPRAKPVNARLWCLATDLVQAAGRTDHPQACSHCNQALMELGALVCTPRNPACDVCPWKRACVAFRLGTVNTLPNVGKRARVTHRRFAVLVLERKRRWVVRRRPAGVLNAGLWEFPNVETTGARVSPAGAVVAILGKPSGEPAPLGSVKCSLTRYRVTFDLFHLAPATGRLPRHLGHWKTPRQMGRLAFSSAQRRILRMVLSRVPG